MTNKIKALLFKLLGIDGYLSVVQMLYRLAYRAGFLKKNKAYTWHYFVASFLQEGDYILDIGANLGYFALPFVDKVKHGGHLYCVEPVLPFQKQLKKLINNKPNTTLFPFALGEENDKQVTLGIPTQFKNLGYLRHGTTTLLHGEEKSNGPYSFKATMKKGSELFATLPKLDYIKCDIEGYETVVFPEMKVIIEKYQPMIQIETWGKQLMTMYHFFKDLGLAAYFLENEKLYPLEKKQEANWGESDILFVPGSKKERIEKFLG